MEELMKAIKIIPALLLATTTFSTPLLAKKEMKQETFIEVQQKQQWLASNLIGENVLNSKNEVIGDINDLVLNDTFKTGAVVIGVGGFLGMGEKDVAVPLSSLNVTRGKDGVIITTSLDKKSLETAPDYKTLENRKGGVKTKIQKQLSEAGDKMKEAGKKAGETIKDAAEKTSDKAKEMYKDAKESVK